MPIAERSTLLGTVGVAVVATYCYLLFHAMNTYDYDIWGALVIGPILVLISWPMIAAIGRSSPDMPWLTHLLWIALGLKLFAGVCRWAVAFKLYDGRADAQRYDLVGKQIADAFHHGIFNAPPQGSTGTGFIMILTGIVYVLIGPSVMGGFLVFSWMGFWGLYLVFKAFAIAVPEGQRKRYATLLFLLPSMLFWPSGIGKEAWVILCIGVTVLGAAWLFTRRRNAYLTMGVGLTGIAVVRPHVALMLFAGIFVGYLVRSNRGQSVLAPMWKLVGAAALICTGYLLVGQATTFLGVEGGLNQESINQQLERAGQRTDEGGSAFTAKPVASPTDLPGAVVTVLFRPFPWEANNGQSLLTAAEGTFLIGLLLLSWPRLKHLPSFAARRPYVLMCLPYILLFVIGFASFGNFGILARQRVQVYPFVLALACLPPRAPDRAQPLSPRRQRVYPDAPLVAEGSAVR